MKADESPKKTRKLWICLWICFVIGAALMIVELLVVAPILIGTAFFRTPRASYWMDGTTYGNTNYFHFKSTNDAWDQSLAIEPPQNVEASYRLAIVEVDEFGDFFQSEKYPSRPEDYQLLCAKQMLTNAAYADRKPVLLFLLVHGWRNDASTNSETLALFRKLLVHLAQSEMSTNYSICGVYIGWRGASIKRWGCFTVPAEYYSFWGRKRVADKIASTRTFAAIFGLVDTARRAAPHPERTPSRIVLAGHSLGAGILMNAVSQGLGYQLARAPSGKADSGASVELESPANLILLLNPAVESVYLRQLRVSMQMPPGTNVYPWLVSLTSKNDWVTKYLFPRAQTLRAASHGRKPPYFEVDWRNYKASDESSRTSTWVSQKVYAKNTPGHNDYMRDLHVEVKKYNEAEMVKFTNFDVIKYNMSHGSQTNFLLRSEDRWPWYGYFRNLRPKKEIHPLFWVATVDRKIMDGHRLPFDDKVRRDNFVGMVMALMADSRVTWDTNTSSKAEIRTIQANPTQMPTVQK